MTTPSAAPPPPATKAADSTRVIWLVDLDAFFVSVERCKDPSLRDRPVVVGYASRERGVVCSASYEARAYGVRSAMPMSRALALCPGAVVVAPDFPAYEHASREVFGRLERLSPALERVSIDEAYLDLTGSELRSRPTGPSATIGWIDVAARVRARLLATTGLSVSIGIATSKSVAKIAADLAKPGGVLEVARGHEAAFLQGLPVEALPGVGPKTRERLATLRIHTIGDLARVPAIELVTSFGESGAALVRRANGIDDTPVDGTARTPVSVSRETTFPTDTSDEGIVSAALSSLVRTATATLRDERLVAERVILRWREADFRTFTLRSRLPTPSNRDDVVLDAISRLRARSRDPRRRLRLVGVSLSALRSDRGVQLPLFEPA